MIARNTVLLTILCLIFLSSSTAIGTSIDFNVSEIENDDSIYWTVSPQRSDNFNFGDNFYTTYGGPDLKAHILGNNEFSSGDIYNLNINLANKGTITGFEIENEADDDLDIKLQAIEKGYETERTTAIGITSVLLSPHSFIDVKSGPQESGTLRSGEQTQSSPKFIVDIDDDAPAGTYFLVLRTVYGYQENVQVSGDELTAEGNIKDVEIGMWYEARSQNHTIPLIIKKEANFEVVNVTSDLRSGEGGVLKVTYRNTGNLPAKDATAKISVYTPFSTTDDQAFLGTLEAGDTAQGVFSLNVDETTISKNHSINSEIRYEDTESKTQLSDTMKISVQTLPAISLKDKILGNTWILVILVILMVASAGMVIYMKLIRKENKIRP
ncbi:COG1361 S-layer family protein [Methanohalophilus mahii]|uniref:S-layer-like domain-containing protein n=1 Tax=Methanohalophilus mahii (strain ATCC 35705 / DSM 5219 / SLP) TaxID=547558 RepID=D5E937_METMS|nr:hypothetical protein [Methanohalophilus mahii]ADE35688.1 hypothetical protein Mmah_0153 [Methanohalophilus mahii DSM 5219]